ncbi:MAG TPA: SDR family oxidoreductase [Polyangiaceae bacterium]|nr:SDR family oxidoreductase [Polyangiaceae bacterium]
MKIQGSNVLVTGSNRGIGRALVEAALERGAARVYATARNTASLEPLGARAGDRVVPLELDVTSEDQIRRAAEKAKDVDLLVNNAGVLASFGVLAGTPKDVQRDMETNFFGLLNLARAFSPVLAARKNSALVSVLSVAALASMPPLGGYSSSKAAAWSLTQALRAELGKQGVRTFAVFPGPVDTDMIRTFDMPKTAPSVVARAILDGVEASVEDIFPDPMSKDVGALFARDPAAVERRFAAPA